MMASRHGSISALVSLCQGNQPVTCKFGSPHHDDVIKWKHFPHKWPFVRGIHWSPVNSPHKGRWRGALMFSLICAWINGWVNNREAGDLKRHRTHYDVTVMRRVSNVELLCFLLVYVWRNGFVNCWVADDLRRTMIFWRHCFGHG